MPEGSDMGVGFLEALGDSFWLDDAGLKILGLQYVKVQQFLADYNVDAVGWDMEDGTGVFVQIIDPRDGNELVSRLKYSRSERQKIASRIFGISSIEQMVIHLPGRAFYYSRHVVSEYTGRLIYQEQSGIAISSPSAESKKDAM